MADDRDILGKADALLRRHVPPRPGSGEASDVPVLPTMDRAMAEALASNLDLQVAAGGETSRLDRVDDDQDARKFFRPKGSVTLGWRPAKGWDVSLKLRRRVGQISFYDFLAQPKLAEDRENYDLLSPTDNVFDALERFRDFQKRGKRLDAILITANASKTVAVPVDRLFGAWANEDVRRVYLGERFIR